jgi:hypothetical protein
VNPALFTCVNADSCELLHFTLPYDAASTDSWIGRAVEVIAATRQGELLPRFTANSDDWRCRICGHRERCWKSP